MIDQTTRDQIANLARAFHLTLPADSALHQLLGVISGDAIPATRDGVRDLLADAMTEKHAPSRAALRSQG